MGNITSSAVKGPLPRHTDGPSPAKRRRFTSPDSFELDRLLAAPQMAELGSALCIEVLKIFHKDSKKVRSMQTSNIPHDFTITKARCRITIFDTSSDQPLVLDRQSKLCDLVTFKNPVGPHRVARIDLPRPFVVPHESILVNRPEDGRLDLSDSYQLLVELEAANGSRWPPLDTNDFGLSSAMPFTQADSTQHWILSSRFDSVVGRLKNSLDLAARLSPQQPPYETDYVMDVDLRWSAGLKALKHADKDSKPCITAIDPEVHSCRFADFQGPNGHGNGNGETSVEPDDESVLGNTPSRSLRTREKEKVYNLKVLSDQAHGRDRTKGGRSGSVTTTVEGCVQYLLPADQPVCLDYFRCVSCGAIHESMAELQTHLRTVHIAFDYVFESTSQGPQFQVSARRETSIKPHGRGHQVRPFHLYTHDQVCVTSRPALENETNSNLSPSRPERLQSGSPAIKGSKPLAQRRPRKQKVIKAVVPDIPQPLYHPISRARLNPGDEVPETEPDNTWLIQRHRESIAEFSDVTPAEKEYIWEWDGYILGKNLTSLAYFPREWLGFVREKATWLVSEKRRMLEFGKHSSALLARNLLNDTMMEDAFAMIDKARAALKQQARQDEVDEQQQPAAGVPSPRQSPKVRKSASGCVVCQLPVLGPTMLICSNTSCSKRLYHSTCIEKSILPIPRAKWLCATVIKKASSRSKGKAPAPA
ncbi:Zinc finger domain-containing protein, PHD-finger [Ophiocordyceps camponoti-floridani]|uniref:Zinc finger domain-containing protein, PHD-finger n=1 Tax=Ophiocordyceps camponoti-floridani TaxID=2030778 RepID=A0A8H4VDP3_9HYPO|nr:Zinc finger domain-containing protein, PHD-finger [Ophiocordyceps camponoti-floridani]